MTEAELILADFILLKIEPKTPFRMQRYLTGVTIGLHDTQPQEIYKEISQLLISNSSVIEDFLRTQGYIKFTDIPTHQYILTEEGEEAQRQGGHEQYLEFIAKKKEREIKGEIPKRNTIIYDAIKIIAGALIGIVIGRFACNQPPKDNNDQSIDQLKMQKSEQATSQQTPNPVDKKADVHVLDSNHYRDTPVATKH